MTKGPRSWGTLASAVRRAGTDKLTDLIELAGLDPARDLRLRDWSGCDLAGCNLEGYDFSGARLLNVSFTGARIAGARFDQAELDRARPRARLDPGRTDLDKAVDFDDYLRSLHRSAEPSDDGHLPTGSVFSDLPGLAPEMVVVPGGSFWMGSPDGSGGDQDDVAEAGRSEDEGPRHKVSIERRFALGRFAVTFEDWQKAQVHTDWKRLSGIAAREPNDEGWGHGRRPVIGVSWEDARAYCRWLSGITGREYRLPSEAEWEHSCRAGTETPWSTGDTISEAEARFAADSTVEVGTFPGNDWGLHDMHGNVWEWCADAWHKDYSDAPKDGAERKGGDLSFRVLRGGSWSGSPQFLRSAIRNRDPTRDFRRM